MDGPSMNEVPGTIGANDVSLSASVIVKGF